jgi:integrase
VGRGEVVDEDFVEVIDAFDRDPAVFRIQGFAHLMPSLTQLAEIHVLDLRVAHREDAAKATARTHWRDVFDHSDETPAWESAFPAHWDRRNLNSHWVHRAIYISPQGPISLTMSITWHLELTNLTVVLAAIEGSQQNRFGRFRFGHPMNPVVQASHLPELRRHAFAQTLFDTGCRINEVIELLMVQIDMDHLLLTVNRKGDKERRVPFSNELRKVPFRYGETKRKKGIHSKCVSCSRNGSKLLYRNGPGPD